MTVKEDTQVQLSANNSIINDSRGNIDRMALALAARVDDQDGLIRRITEERDSAQLAFSNHMADPLIHPPVVEEQYNTLFGLGGGNVARMGVQLDRRYYGPNDMTKMVSDTTNNELKGIVSWNSMKCPYSWAEMAAGRGDDWFKNIMKTVNEAIKPVVDDPDDVDEVWFSAHHEPEGDFDEDDWRVMQDRLSRLVPGGIEGPIKFYLTTTGWGQEFNTQRVAQEVDWETNLFPHGAPIYGIAYDAPYNTYGYVWKNGVKTTEFNKSVTDPYVYIDALAKRGVQFDVEVAVGEWGFSDEMFALDPTWGSKVMGRAIDNPFQKLRGMAYFDTQLNSAKSWTLGTANSAKRKRMMADMDRFRAMQAA